MLGNITRHILYHSYSKELNLKKIKTGWNEGTLRNSYSSGLENICEGIYEDIANNDNKYKLGVKLIDGKLYIIYLGGALWKKDWSEGELKAILEPTATPNFYKAEWIGAMKNKMQGYVTFEQGIMKSVINGETTTYLKLYPTTSDVVKNSKPESWSGSGFALNNGYLITNYHVIEDAKSIVVKGVKGNFTEAYQVEIVASDKYNDLALLKINDNRFTGFGTIPYKVKTTTSEVGEDVFVLGYPMRSTMGDEIKLTTGVISSKTGFQGDVSLYQISAPVQPGNSGGPLFDGKGNLIGIVSAKHTGAENVGYAIKTSYLKNLVETVSSSAAILPLNNSISDLSLTSKVKNVKNFVFMIECFDKELPLGDIDKSKPIAQSGSKVQQNGVEWVDLGLPSGTLWKGNNEDDGFYTYDKAVSIFGSKLPTREQFEELKKSCQWTWLGNGYKVVGRNGNYIVLPAAGCRYCNGSVVDVGVNGCYWSSTPDDSEGALSLSFGSGEVDVDIYYRCSGLSVRLVKD